VAALLWNQWQPSLGMGGNLRLEYALRHIKLVQLLGPNGALWQVTEPRSQASKRLKSLQIKPPSPILMLG